MIALPKPLSEALEEIIGTDNLGDRMWCEHLIRHLKRHRTRMDKDDENKQLAKRFLQYQVANKGKSPWHSYDDHEPTITKRYI